MADQLTEFKVDTDEIKAIDSELQTLQSRISKAPSDLLNAVNDNNVSPTIKNYALYKYLNLAEINELANELILDIAEYRKWLSDATVRLINKDHEEAQKIANEDFGVDEAPEATQPKDYNIGNGPSGSIAGSPTASVAGSTMGTYSTASTVSTYSTYGTASTASTYGTYSTASTVSTFSTYGTASTASTYGTYSTASTVSTYSTYGTASTASTYGTFSTAGTASTYSTYGTASTASTYGTFSTAGTYSTYGTAGTYGTGNGGSTYGTYGTYGTASTYGGTNGGSSNLSTISVGTLSTLGGGYGTFSTLGGGGANGNGTDVNGITGGSSLNGSSAKSSGTSSLLSVLSKGTTKLAGKISPGIGAGASLAGQKSFARAGLSAAGLALGTAGIASGLYLAKKTGYYVFTPEDWEETDEEIKNALKENFFEAGMKENEFEEFLDNDYRIKSSELNEHIKKIEKAYDSDVNLEEEIIDKYHYSIFDENNKVDPYLLFLTMATDGMNTTDEVNLYNILNPYFEEDDIDFIYSGINLEEYIYESEDIVEDIEGIDEVEL